MLSPVSAEPPGVVTVIVEFEVALLAASVTVAVIVVDDATVTLTVSVAALAVPVNVPPVTDGVMLGADIFVPS